MSSPRLPLRLESTSFPAEEFHVRKVEAREAISEVSRYVVDVVVPTSLALELRDVLAARVTLVLEGLGDPDDTRRYHLHVYEVVEELDRYDGQRALRLVLVPRFVALGAIEMSETFVDVSVPELIRSKLESVDLTESRLALRLRESYAPREFVVQFAESDLAFLSRLTEHLGISYFFEHGEREAQVVFCDHEGGFGVLPGPALQLGPRVDGSPCQVLALAARQRLVGRLYSVHDHDERSPLVDLTAEQEMPEGFGGGIIEYGTNHKTREEATLLARVRAEEFHCREVIYEGRSNATGLAAGMRCAIEGHPTRGRFDVCLVEVTFVATQGGSGADDGGVRYENAFKAIAAGRTFRPKRVTAKPRIHGVVTGVVDAGPGVPVGPYAVLDLAGRYFVRFHFDTQHPGDRAASLPVRMAQNHAGAGYGTHFPLKPGTEVAVGFVNGDPDRPVILGALPNAIAPSPVSALNAGVHRIQTSTGVRIDLVE